MRENLLKLRDNMNKFVGSDAFLVLNALAILLTWTFKVWVIALPVIAAINILPLFFNKSVKHLLGILMMFSLSISSYRHELSSYAPMLSIFIFLFAGLIFNLFFFKRDFSCLAPSKIKGFHCSLIALIIPTAFAGVAIPSASPLARVAALALFVVFALGYSIFTIIMKDSDDRSDLMEYMLKILFLMGIITTVEMVIYFARLDSSLLLKYIKLKKIALGWAGANNVAPTLSMCIPATLYFCIRKNNFTPVFAALAMIEYALLFLTGCRGAILFTTIAMPAMILYVMAKTNNKLLFGLSITVVIAVAVILIALYGNTVTDVLVTILNKGLHSSGRTEWLYPEAFDLFKRSPIFGGGWDYKLGGSTHDGYSPYWFHSTALQIVATMGVVGVIAYVFFYFFRYRTFIAMRRSHSAMAILAGLVLFDAYGMIDTNFFGPTFFLMLMAMTFVVEINLPDNKCRAFGGYDPFKLSAAFIKRTFSQLKLKLHERGKKDAIGYFKGEPESELSPSDSADMTDESAPTDEEPVPDVIAEEALPHDETIKSE